MKGKALSKHSLHEKTASSVLWKRFISYALYNVTTLMLSNWMLIMLPGSNTPVPVTKFSSTAGPAQGNVT